MILIASDHGGLDLKEGVKAFLGERGLEVKDLGTTNGDSVDYPDFGVKVARAVSSRRGRKRNSDLRNRYRHVDCRQQVPPGAGGPCLRRIHRPNVQGAQQRQHHRPGGRVIAPDHVGQIVGAWLDAGFEGGRHQRRLEKIAQIEEDVRLGRL